MTSLPTPIIGLIVAVFVLVCWCYAPVFMR